MRNLGRASAMPGLFLLRKGLRPVGRLGLRLVLGRRAGDQGARDQQVPGRLRIVGDGEQSPVLGRDRLGVDQRICPHGKAHLARDELVELECQVLGGMRIRVLLMRQAEQIDRTVASRRSSALPR